MFDDKTKVVKSNQLIEASYKLSVQEQRIILLLASMVKRTDDDFKLYKIKIKDFMEIVGVKDIGKYKEIQEQTKQLVKKELTIIKKDGNPLQMTWLASADYYKGYVELEFSVKLKPYLLKLKDRFASYQLKNVIGLRGRYSIRIYEILKANQYKGEANYTIEELKTMLGIETGKYKQIGHFNNKVLIPAHKEINDKTDLKYSMTLQKKGRKIIGMWFFIKKHNPSKKKNDEIKNPELYIKLKDYYCLQPKDAIEVIDLHEKQPERINANLEYVKIQHKAGKVKSVAPYTLQAIKENWKTERTLWDNEEIEQTRKQKIAKLEKEFKENLKTEYTKAVREKADEYQMELAEIEIEDIRDKIVKEIKDDHKKKGRKQVFGLNLLTRLALEKHFADLAGFPLFEEWEKEKLIEFDKQHKTDPILVE